MANKKLNLNSILNKQNSDSEMKDDVINDNEANK
jgi:hypothetical protein